LSDVRQRWDLVEQIKSPAARGDVADVRRVGPDA
jgi:hypothetical protein